MYMDDIKLLTKNEKELETLYRRCWYTAMIQGWNLAKKDV